MPTHDPHDHTHTDSESHTAHSKTHTHTEAAAKSTHTKAPTYYPRSSGCTPFKSSFPSGSVASKEASNPSEPFVALSPDGSWAVGGDGLELYLQRPKGEVNTKDGVNDVVADGATVNSTFTML